MAIVQLQCFIHSGIYPCNTRSNADRDLVDEDGTCIGFKTGLITIARLRVAMIIDPLFGLDIACVQACVWVCIQFVHQRR